MPATLEKKRAFGVYQTQVDQIHVLTPRNKGFLFRLLDGKTMDFKPGQFVQVYVPIPGGQFKRRAYSIASTPNETQFELVVTLVEGGIASPKLHEIPERTVLNIMGPLGHFVLPERLERDVVFIATGSGIAPFRSMIRTLLERGTDRNLYLIFGNRYDADIIYQTEWEELATRYPNLKLLFTLSRPSGDWQGHKGYVQEWIEPFVPDLGGKDFYICGLNNMITDVEKKLTSMGVPQERIHFERYD